MGQPNLEKDRTEFMKAVSGMYDELRQWRAQHPGASIDEIANQITPKRRELMGQLLIQLACQYGDGEVIEGVSCPECGEGMSYKGKPSRDVIHKEGEEELVRSYYYCARCEAGLFPPG
jgi:DNA-directed RNA polymerase subunit RPC12/RpoP